jgi:antitoxin ParD1/3/4
MIMFINLSPEMEGFIKNKVADGLYGNATEVIQDAISRMQAEETRMNAWQSAIRQADEQLDRGEGIPYTATTLEDITQRAFNALHLSDKSAFQTGNLSDQVTTITT